MEKSGSTFAGSISVTRPMSKRPSVVSITSVYPLEGSANIAWMVFVSAALESAVIQPMDPSTDSPVPLDLAISSQDFPASSCALISSAFLRARSISSGVDVVAPSLTPGETEMRNALRASGWVASAVQAASTSAGVAGTPCSLARSVCTSPSTIFVFVASSTFSRRVPIAVICWSPSVAERRPAATRARTCASSWSSRNRSTAFACR